jgi:hypothetical protein
MDNPAPGGVFLFGVQKLTFAIFVLKSIYLDRFNQSNPDFCG